MKICVVGAGVMGLTTAYSLVKRGHDVTIIDSCSAVGQGSSFGNGAQLSYSYVAPLADRSVWKNLPHYLFHPQSPLTLRPKLDVAQWQWCVKFLMACNSKRSEQTTISLLKLAFFSREKLALLQNELSFDFNFRTAGKLVLYSSEAALKGARKQVDFQKAYSCEQKILSLQECLKIEPALARANASWVGGVYTASEQAGDCALFCSKLSNVLKKNSNITFMFNTVVTGSTLSQEKLAAFKTTTGEITADAFVLANGTGSAALASQMGFGLPIYPLKGYSITLDTNGGEGIPSVSITDLANKIVYARIGNRLRVAGRVEIIGHDLRIPPERSQSLLQHAKNLFPALGSPTDISPWAGNRPATPTGMPIIGKTPVANVYVNSGQGALGWTLACGSAELLANQLEGRTDSIDGQEFAYHS